MGLSTDHSSSFIKPRPLCLSRRSSWALWNVHVLVLNQPVVLENKHKALLDVCLNECACNFHEMGKNVAHITLGF